MKWLEGALWMVGVTLILIFFGTHARGEAERQRDLAAFAQVQLAVAVQGPVLAASSMTHVTGTIAVSGLGQPPDDEVLAILRVAGIGLELPVRYGTEDQVLRRGPGLIEGTSLPGSDGHVAIAAHRDLHFRGLKDLSLGDLIELEMPGFTKAYIVTSLSVVKPTDIHVLDEVGKAVLTLVTCYPFYFVGNAPKRFIVRAEAVEFLNQEH